ncbi:MULTISPECIES: SCO2583/SCO2584 N-terminal domain-containing protein [Actinomadura]|uniref:SCO2583/SCO2584 N-terminal domain-containing protein n=1 Tax=Actinomadura TaxID=1988 RepID=UPI0004034E33|nr:MULTISPECIES: hypothetical protein [Actinomadura]RSN56887.1 hypothetical protein DMH08_24435 [Actinomadura sp. WAC 06369]
MPADFDEPVFDEDFVRGAAFTEPSARERARPPSRRDRRAAHRAARRRGRAARPPRGRRFRDPSHRMAVAQLLGGIMVLLAISVALWWWNSPSREMEAPGRVEPAPTTTVSPPVPSAEPSGEPVPPRI